ncbi:hypothetical protein Nepgr_027841 [Nepenthes gracilis]|uniref:Uncharacterized protein n=1 Tax=Nepenthes gracilis TaxID=150966 RepID=A0AAD3T9G7_NEPGR|nr:hypothetical protein Nepgr_027841 [Nepenthes gracilis]
MEMHIRIGYAGLCAEVDANASLPKKSEKKVIHVIKPKDKVKPGVDALTVEISANPKAVNEVKAGSPTRLRPQSPTRGSGFPLLPDLVDPGLPTSTLGTLILVEFHVLGLQKAEACQREIAAVIGDVSTAVSRARLDLDRCQLAVQSNPSVCRFS